MLIQYSLRPVLSFNKKILKKRTSNCPDKRTMNPEKRKIKQKFATLPLFLGDLPSWTFGIFLLDAGRRFAFAATFPSSSSSLYANSESCIHSGTGFCSCTFRVG
jgi:hypothetical protein